MKKQRKSYFSELRSKQLLERRRNEQRNRFALPITRVPLPPMRNSLSDILDEVDIWSFEGRTGASVNLIPGEAAGEKSDHNQQEQDAQDGVQLPVHEYFSCGSHQVSPGQEYYDNQDAGPSLAFSAVSNQFRKFNEGSRLKQVLSKSILSKTPRVGTSERNLCIDQPPPSPEGTSPVAVRRQNENEEVSLLESSIVSEDSPVKVIKRRRRLRPLSLNSSPKIHSASHLKPNQTILFSQSPSPRKTTKVLPSQGHRNNNVPNYSSQISEIQSSSQSTQFSPVSKTPLSIWIYQDQTEMLNVEESALEKDDQESVPGNKLGISSLIKSFKEIKARYDTSVRLFHHDFRKGKYDGETAVHFFIRKIVDRQDKMVITLAYDLKENRSRWVLFKPVDGNEISEGVSLKIYPPWQEVSIPETDESMFICSDFCKIVRNSDVGLTEKRVEEINQVPIPTICSIRISDSLFMDMVPFHVKNRNTFHNHTKHFHSYLDIAVVILYAWTQCTPAMFLLKDSDDFLSFMEVPKTNPDIITTLQPGKFVQLKQIALAEKVLISKKLAPFSVMCMFGGRQTHYFNLRWTAHSTCQVEERTDIPMVKMSDELANIEEVYNAPVCQDYRITLKCTVKEKDANYILVSDELDKSLQIEFIADPAIITDHLSCDLNKTVILNFLRVIHGKTLWDHFTTWELAPDDDDSFESL